MNGFRKADPVAGVIEYVQRLFGDRKLSPRMVVKAWRSGGANAVIEMIDRGFAARLTPRLDAVVQASAAIRAAGHTDADLLLAEAATSGAASIQTSRQLFWAADRAGNAPLAHAAATRLEGFLDIETGTGLDPAPDNGDVEVLTRFKRRFSYKLGLVERFGAAAPTHSIPLMQGRIAYLLQSSLPYVSSGYPIRAHGLASALQQGGLDVFCVTRPGFPQIRVGFPPEELVPDSEVIEGVRYQRLSFVGKPADLDYFDRAADVTTALLVETRPQLVMAASPYWNAVPGLIAARRIGAPFYYEIRGFGEITQASYSPEFVASDRFEELSRLEGAVARAADHVFTLTRFMADELARKGVDPERISLLPNACDADRFAPMRPDSELRAQLGLPPDIAVIGFIGSFEAYEGLDDLIRAAAQLRQNGSPFRLLLVGGENSQGLNPGALTAKLMRLSIETGLGDWMIVHPPVPHDQVPAHLSLIDVVCIPRKPLPVTEMVSPLKPLEAMAMEKAVVVSSVAALAEMVEDGVTGCVFAKGDIGHLVETLARLVDDAPFRRSLGAAARRWVLAERTWDGVAERARREFANKR